MDRKFDEKIRKGLIQDLEPLPVSYTDKIGALLEELPNIEKKHTKKFNMKYVVAAVIVLLLGSSGTYAAVNVYQEHLSSMSREEKKRLNEKTQKVAVASDQFSRELSAEECEQLELMQKKYEKEGILPQEKITEVDQKEEVMEGQLAFCYEDSTFYLPDTELTEEELLMIIDFWERRDYAVKEENSEKSVSDDNQAVSEEKALQIARVTLHDLYGLDAEGADSNIEFDVAEISEQESLPSYFVSLEQESWNYNVCVEIDSGNGAINGIDITHKTKEECVSGIKVNEKKYEENLDHIYDLLTKLEETNRVEEIRLIYKYREDGTLNRGNIKYLVELEDGSAYVFLYSENTEMVYNFYKMPSYKELVKQEKKNEKVHKQAAILTKSIVIMK